MLTSLSKMEHRESVSQEAPAEATKAEPEEERHIPDPVPEDHDSQAPVTNADVEEQIKVSQKAAKHASQNTEEEKERAESQVTS